MTNPIDASTQHADDPNDATTPAKPSLRVSELGSSATQHPAYDATEATTGIGYRVTVSVYDYGGRSITFYSNWELRNCSKSISSWRFTSWRSNWTSNCTMQGTSTPMAKTVFPWLSEFSWRESGLCFGDEPMKIIKTPEDHYSKIDSGSESVLVGMGSYFEHSSLTELSGSLEAGSTMCSISSGTPSVSGITDSDTAMESFQNDPLIVMQQCVDWTIELLVDNFFRSYAPRSSKGRATGTSPTSIQTAPCNRACERPGPSRGGKARPNTRKRKALGGDEGSEDEGSQRSKRTPTGIELAEDSLGWACPFVKWKPKRYNCLVAPKEIRKLKGHIKNIHWIEHCDNCFVTNPPAPHDKKLCVPSRPRPGFITEEMKVKIEQRESCLQSHEEQWNRIYRVLFPGAKLPKTPYLDKETKDHVMTAKEYRDSPDCKDIIEEELNQLNLRGKTRERFRNWMRESLVPKLVQRLKLTHELSAEMAQGDPQAVDPTLFDHIGGSSPREMNTALDSSGQTSPPSQGETITYDLFPGLEPAQDPMFRSQLSTEDMNEAQVDMMPWMDNWSDWNALVSYPDELQS
ncbi:unnamed protein product [Fusarium equiseti]|uniref:Uncharacterized protein n=1 Tax=Fusarium equiseti TaxID=61235 RepID=A0A8J2IT63_FUSEQ|nr:unnamed protein product [Fusarium equiseti]